MEPDFSNMTLNEYLMYQGRHKDLERSCTSWKSVAPVRNKILVYPDFDEEDEEYCSLPPLLPCFQTLHPYATFNYVNHNSHNEVDIENMTLEEYARYELAMSTMKSEIQLVQVDTQGVVLRLYLATRKHFKSGLVGYHADDDGLELWMLLMEADLKHGLVHVVSSSSRANPGDSFVLILLLFLTFHFFNVQ
ncbi:hypothetical protein Tco_1516229 [Tanacetum coccineum]